MNYKENFSLKRKVLKIFIWSFFIIAIFILALLDLESMFPDFNFSKGADMRHIVTFAAFIPLTMLTFPDWKLPRIIGIAMFFGIGIEIAQELITSGARNFTWSDLLYDLTGIITGSLIGLFIFYIRKTISKR